MSELVNAIKQICEEKGLSYDAVVTTIESALAAAYRKDFGKKNQNIKVEFNPELQKSKVFDVKTVVEDLPEEEAAKIIAEEEAAAKAEEKDVLPTARKKTKAGKEPAQAQAAEPASEARPEEAAEAAGKEGEERKFNPKTEIQLKDAKLVKKTAKIGDEIKTKLDVPEEYGRMAAQTAKQVIIQRLREAEREMIFGEFKDKEKEVVSGVVQRREGRVVLVDLGKAIGLLLAEDQIPGEFYRPGERIKVFVKEVNFKAKGPEILLSRTADDILKKVFYLEIPEISNGLIELKSVAREAGYRSKVAVWTDSDNVDPIGSCVGQRGSRIQTIINELGGEKVDIIEYDDDPIKFITNALSPARVIGITIDEKTRKATVAVGSDQLSLAIGKGGQNARLAAKLTGWKVDIVEAKKEKEPAEKKDEATVAVVKAEPVALEKAEPTEKEEPKKAKKEKKARKDKDEAKEGEEEKFPAEEKKEE
ncbi:MAG: transcription termination factor NusA [Planctomycetes bacterium]|jgi:N utilization substance protein A|nr:transcription termination factor NusA [Planctomycetota bacterium]